MLPATRRIGFVAAAVLLLLSPRPRAGTVAEGAFQRYARGDFAVIEGLTADQFEVIRHEVKASALSPRMKAAFLLEAFETFQRRLQLDSGVGHIVDGKFGFFDGGFRSESFPLFQEAYDALAAVPVADEFVAAWFRAAAAAVAHGDYGQSDVERPWFRNHVSDDRFHFDAHVDAGELALIRALPIERFAWRSLYQDRLTYVKADQEAQGKMVGSDMLADQLGREKAAIPRALADLKKADAFESARAESLLRQGALVAASGHPEQALPLLEESERLTHDGWVTYLDRLCEGRALETLDRVAAAEASYRGALTLRPKSRSANLALSALLFAHGTRADANLLAAFDAGSDRLDPWAQFTFGAYRFWPDRRDAMRRLLK